MSQMNPYSRDGQTAVAAADAPVAERAQFLQRTYTWVLGGILLFCATMAAAESVPFVNNLVVDLATSSPWLRIALIFGMSILVHSLAENSPINKVMFVLNAVVWGILIAPFVMIANEMNPNIVTQASLITAVVFIGLTAYVFVSGKDFSFLRGILFITLFGMFGVAIAGLIFGFSVIGALLFAGFILYDTSQVLHHYPTHAHITAAIVLFTDVVMLFKHILILLMSQDD